MKKLLFTLAVVIITVLSSTGCCKVEHRLVGVGEYKYDNINGLIYEKNEFNKWVPTGEKIYFKGEF